MLVVLISYLNILVAGLGMGLIFFYLVGIRKYCINPEVIIKISMAGFAITLASASYISLIGPVDSWVNMGFTVISFFVVLRVIFVWQNEKDLEFYTGIESSKNQFSGQSLRFTWVSLVFIIPLIIAGLFSIVKAAQIPQIFDTWFYHLQAIKWIEEYGVVKGLGNLFSNAAYNSSVFIGNAIFSLKPLADQNYFGVNAFLWLTTLVYAIFRTIRYVSQQKYASIVIENTLIFLVYRYFYLWLSSSSQDPASASILIFCFFMFRDLLRGEAHEIDKITLALLLITLVTIKLSNIIFIIPAGFLLFSNRKQHGIRSIYLFVLPIFILLPWMVRSVIMTGYLFYPFHFPDLFSVDWKVPYYQVLYEEMLIRSWARSGVLPDGAVSFFPVTTWFNVWFEGIGLQNRILLILAVISAGGSSILVMKRRKEIKPIFIIFWLAVTGSLVLWFLSAPSPRFVFAILLISILLVFEFFNLNSIFKLKSIGILILFIVLAFTLEPDFRGKNLRYPSDLNFFCPPPFPATVVKNSIYNGIMLNYADPDVSLESYDAEIPCTPQIRKGLILRGKGLAEGFRIDPELQGPNENNFLQIKTYYQSQQVPGAITP